MKKIIYLLIVTICLPVELLAQSRPVQAVPRQDESAQSEPVQVYQVTVITNFGRKFSGYLYDVNSTQLIYSGTRTSMDIGAGIARIPLRDIRRVKLYGGNKRAGTIEGAIIGAAGVTFLALKSLQKSPLRSPAMTGMSLLLAASGGAAFGAFLGAVGSNMGRRGIKISKREGDEQFLQAQLTPFTYTYQLNRSQNDRNQKDQYFEKESY